MKIRVSQQVVGFVRTLAPEPRRKVRLALKSLARGRGDIKALEGPLSSYWRLGVSSYRVIFRYGNRNEIECVFAERRSIVYEVFAEAFRERLARGS